MTAFDKCVQFLKGIGICVTVKPGASGFLTGVEVRRGSLFVASPTRSVVGDMLHEAGHIAVLPSMFRQKFNGDLDRINRHLERYIKNNRTPDPDEDPIIRAILQSGECEAIAWSYAAAVHIGINSKLPFMKGFEGNGMSVHTGLAMGCHLGIHGLKAGGMTDLPRAYRSEFPFPKMKRWMQI